MAFLHTLELAADKSGHTHLPWDVLLSETLRLMSSSGEPVAHDHKCYGPFAAILPACLRVFYHSEEPVLISGVG